jgi:orotate phosphoribosyltransferase
LSAFVGSDISSRIHVDEALMQPMRRSAEPSRPDHRAELFELSRVRSFGRGRIMLASGRESDFYFDLRPTTMHPAGATYIGEMIMDALEGLAVDCVGGLEMGAVPIAAAAAIASHRRGRDLQAFFVRKKAKDHGAKKLVEGLPKGETLKGRNVVIVEDVTTTGGSAIQAVEAVQAAGANVVLVLTIVDRLEGATDNFAALRLPFRALFTADEFLALSASPHQNQ